MIKKLRLELGGERSYDILISRDWLGDLPGRLSFINRKSRHAVISDETVFGLYGPAFLEIMRGAGYDLEPLVFPGGETSKTLETFQDLQNRMVAAGLDRSSAVFALGGGIPGDVAGFAASTYMRGIQLVQVPTTLLAQVDSSVGGKTGVNLARGKNLVGTFYQPNLVFIDVSLLNTLSSRDYNNGLAEVVKYGIIWDADFFAYLEENAPKIVQRDSSCLIEIIGRCCAIKAAVVAEDEKEQGARALLNLGHTFGHAFEAIGRFEAVTHGEAVAVGTHYAARLARQKGLLDQAVAERIDGLLASFHLPLSYPGPWTPEEVVATMYADKKTRAGSLNLILPTAIGRAAMFNACSEAEILASLAVE